MARFCFSKSSCQTHFYKYLQTKGSTGNGKTTENFSVCGQLARKSLYETNSQSRRRRRAKGRRGSDLYRFERLSDAALQRRFAGHAGLSADCQRFSKAAARTRRLADCFARIQRLAAE